ncbi:MAG: sugar phosphate isomerase/epimerase [Candidatus Bathyarchaeia archaeon]
MRYGAMNFPARPVLAELEAIGRMGFDFIELTMDPPEATPEKLLANREPISDALSAHGMDAIAHLPCFVRTADLYDSIRLASRMEVFKAIDALPELGIRIANLHPSYIPRMARHMGDHGLRLGMDFLREALERAEEKGVDITIENMCPSDGWLSEPEEFEEVLRAFPRAGFTLDLGHANLLAPRNRSIEFLRRFGGRLRHLHVHDNFGLSDEHLPPLCGNVDFAGIFSAIKRSGYDGTMTLEVFSKDRDYLRIALEKAKGLWGSA